MLSGMNFSNFQEKAYLVASGSTIIDVGDEFFHLTSYSKESVLNKPVHHVFDELLRINLKFSKLSHFDDDTSYFIFTKSLQAKEVSISVCEFPDSHHTVYALTEKKGSSLEKKLPTADKLIIDDHLGVGIYYAKDLTLLKANHKYLETMPEPYNITENALGKKLSDFITPWEGSVPQKTWNGIVETGETAYWKEVKGYSNSSCSEKYWDKTIIPIAENGRLKYIVTLIRDVTESVINRIRAGRHLNQMGLIISNVSDGLYLYHQNKEITALNKEAGKLLFYQKSEETSGNMIDDIHFFDRENNEIAPCNLPGEKILNGETLKDFFLAVKKLNKTKYYSISGSPIRDENGTISSALICSHDITDLIKNEKHLQEQYSDLLTIAENVSDLIFVLDNNGNYLHANKAGKKFRTGKHISERNFVFYDLEHNPVPETDLPYYVALRTKQTIHKVVSILADEGKHGEIFLDISAVPFIDKNNCVSMVIICATDITEHLKQAKMILHQNEQFEVIFDNITEELYIFDTELNYIKTNQLTKARYNTMKLRGMSDFYNSYIYTDLSGKRIEYSDMPEARIIRREELKNHLIIENGTTKKYLSCNGKPMFDEKGNVIFGILTIKDVTKDVEYKNNLENLLTMKDEFLSLISHEFKTPLTIINSAIQTMEATCSDQIPKNVKKYIDKIRQNTFRQLRLVNNLLDVTHTNVGHMKLNPKNLDIVFITRSLVDSVYLYASQKRIDLSFQTTFKSKVIGIDEEKYERILLNLLSNAIKFTPGGKTISVKLYKRKKNVCIEVADTGIGIPDSKLDLIFERFGQVNNSTTRQAEGTGIGLSLVKRFAEAMNGKVTVKSKIGEGSVFTVLLPAVKVEESRDIESFVELANTRLIHSTAIEFSDIYL